ncbi:MAG TPA: SDR family oxidoreductase [Bryobacteraceae bacterium]|nr:SDR family oxidoreductase [Bryobacteraceae bacterium]
MSNTEERTLLVTGASGHLGRRVVALLLEGGAGRVVATTRAPEKIADLGAKGAVLRKASFEEPATLAGAFAGAHRLLMISTDAIDQPGRRIQQHRNAVESAARAGIRHICYTSMPNPETSPVIFAPDHLGTEQAIAASGMGYTILRNSWYMDFLIPTLIQAVASGRLFSAAGEGGAAYISREDCARCAAAALMATDAASQTLDVTGPDVVSFRDLARITSNLTARTIEYIPVTPEERKKQLIAAGIPPLYAEIMVSSQLAMAQGKMGPSSTTVKDLTGREPMSIEEFLTSQRNVLLGAAAKA